MKKINGTEEGRKKEKYIKINWCDNIKIQQI